MSKTLEFSIYLKPNVLRRGIGKKLYQKLIDEVKKLSYKIVICGVVDNPGSSSGKFHEKMGFRKVGQLEEVGFKFGQWWTVEYYQLDL